MRWRLTSSSSRTESDQQVKTFGLPEPIEWTGWLVLTPKSLALFGVNWIAIFAFTIKGVGVKIQKAATLEVVMVEWETGMFRELRNFSLHVLYGPVIERVPEFVVRLRGSRGHGAELWKMDASLLGARLFSVSLWGFQTHAILLPLSSWGLVTRILADMHRIGEEAAFMQVICNPLLYTGAWVAQPWRWHPIGCLAVLHRTIGQWLGHYVG
jgi:hypothetical protein